MSPLFHWFAPHTFTFSQLKRSEYILLFKAIDDSTRSSGTLTIDEIKATLYNETGAEVATKSTGSPLSAEEKFQRKLLKRQQKQDALSPKSPNPKANFPGRGPPPLDLAGKTYNDEAGMGGRGGLAAAAQKTKSFNANLRPGRRGSTF